MAENLNKQPAETRIYGMSFKNKLRTTTETIDLINSVTVYPDDATLTAVQHSISADLANVTVAAGTNKRTYKITVVVTTSDGQILENEGLIDIRDK